MSKARILFVDDEVAILEGLQNLLRKERARWDMVFATGGEKALAELAKQPFDIVVSDMRMPGMDGAELLAKVKALHPRTARLVLSGHADREAVLRAIPVAHQFLSKPCEADTLRTAIERTTKLHQLLENESVRVAIGSLDKLPSLPAIYTELTAAAADPMTDIAAFAAIIEKDPAMTAKILQLVNSAYFGLAQRVTSIKQAVTFLGIDLIKGLALTANAFASAPHSSPGGFSLERLQNASMLTARLARQFVDKKHADEAFASGMVADVGSIVIALGMPDHSEHIAAHRTQAGTSLHEAEEHVLGVSHAEVGAYLLGVWGLPFSIVETVAYHHRPSGIAEGPCEILAAVHAADLFADTLIDETDLNEVAFDMAFLERTGFVSQLDRWRDIAAEETRRLRGAA